MGEPKPGARHTAAAVSTPREIVWRFVKRGRPHYVVMLLSSQGRMVLERKYDAFTTDSGYDLTPSGKWGPVGKLVDMAVRRFPVHAALRHRLELVVGALVDAVGRAPGEPVRVLSAPCGLGRDVLTLAGRVGRDRIQLVALDIDEKGDVLPELRRRAAAAGVPVETVRADLFGPELSALPRFDVVNCIGLTAWVADEDLPALFGRLAALTTPGGTLVVDNWRRHAHSKLGDLLEIPTRYHPMDRFAALLREAGFETGEPKVTPDGIVEVWTAVTPR